MTSSSRNTLLVAVLAAALGHGAAWRMMPPSREAEILRVLERQSAQADALAASLANVQAQLRELQARPVLVPAPAMPPPLPVAASAPVVPPSVAPQAPEPAPPPATPESLETLAHGHQILDDAIATHRWGPTELAELRQVMVELNGPQRLEVVKKLSAALNRGDFQGTLSSLVVE